MSEYVVIYERDDAGGWGAYLPDLPGVVALGATRDEVSDRIGEAIGAYGEEMAALGRRLPDSVLAAGTIERSKARVESRTGDGRRNGRQASNEDARNSRP